MAVSARFYVSEVTHRAYNQSHVTVKLQVSSRGEENKAWATSTPSGSIEMSITNPDAAGFFTARLGQDVAVNFDELGPARYATPYQQEPSPVEG